MAKSSGCLCICHLAYFQFKPHTTVTGRHLVIKKFKHLPRWIRSTELKSRKNLVLLLSLTICPYGLWSNTTCSILFPNHHEKMVVRGSVISLLRKLIIKPACLRKISSGPIRQTKIQNIFKLKKGCTTLKENDSLSCYTKVLETPSPSAFLAWIGQRLVKTPLPKTTSSQEHEGKTKVRSWLRSSPSSLFSPLQSITRNIEQRVWHWIGLIHSATSDTQRQEQIKAKKSKTSRF